MDGYQCIQKSSILLIKRCDLLSYTYHIHLDDVLPDLCSGYSQYRRQLTLLFLVLVKGQ